MAAVSQQNIMVATCGRVWPAGILGFALYPEFKKSSRKKIPWYDWIFIALSIAVPIYVFIRYPVFTSTGFKGE